MSPKQWRCYDRCLLGLMKWKRLGKPVRFLTLTLPSCNCVIEPCNQTLDGDVKPIHDNKGKKLLIQSLWRILQLRIARQFGGFEYFSVRTPEGNGVIHVVLVSDFIPYKWIMEQWVEIGGTCYIWINDPYKHRRTPKDVSKYLMSQYLGEQPDFTYGWSRNWVYGGFSKDFEGLRRSCRDFDVSPIVLYGREIYPIDFKLLFERFEFNMKLRFPDYGIIERSCEKYGK